MRFSFRRKPEPRWIDTPDFAWVPDEPFDLTPSNDRAPSNDSEPPSRKPAEAQKTEPAASEPPKPEAPEPAACRPTAYGPNAFAPAAFRAPFVERRTHQADAQPFGKRRATDKPAAQPDMPASDMSVPDLGDLSEAGRLGGFAPAEESFSAERETPPAEPAAAEMPHAPAPSAEYEAEQPQDTDSEEPRDGETEDEYEPEERSPLMAALHGHSLLLARLLIGLAQGFGLFVLIRSRDAGVMPGADPYLFSGLALATLLAPLVLIEGLGEISAILLLAWTGVVAAGLTGLGLYHHWRIQGHDLGHPGFALIILCGLILFIAQAMMRTWLNERGHKRAYRIAFEAGWTLAARLAVWIAITGTAWAFLGTGGTLINWLRPQGVDIGIDPAIITMPLVGVISAFALHVTADRSMLMRRARTLLMSLATVSLPLMVGVGVSLLVANFTRSPVPAPLLMACAVLLVIAINASYRGYGARSRFQRWPEFAAAFVILALTAVAAAGLSARVGQYGWTALRVYACATVIVLTCYGILYGGAALISIGGGRWMQRLEPANFMMAFALIAGCIALATPLADPVQIAANAQAARLKDGLVEPAAFDFGWLRGQGLRFGHVALEEMTGGPLTGFSPEVARDAAITLSTAPDSAAPTPTEIGANITVRTPGARLPNALLAQDWTAQKDSVPPCLTVAALSCDAWFMDLDGDGRNEILLVYGNDAHWWASVMKPFGDQWRAVATLTSPPCGGSLSAMRAGEMAPTDPLPGWRDLWVAGERLRLKPTDGPGADCSTLDFRQ
ncbi:MAG: DUF4153 domain-containing protein [Alphaproteobacteria bacterium]|nr:DUF4153 domain-containing protein [Alphaproteobacteria bacterium]